MAACGCAIAAWGGDALPVDTALRMGTLPCGMTYYIRANAYPQARAEMWMAHRVGSVVETDGQQGYTHLLEHMAFNGTSHFPGTTMVNYLTSLGMGYGSDINASTSFDDTQYQLSNVPTTSWAALDSALLALSDLSCSLTLDACALEKEKAVVEQEWRHRGGYSMRMFDAVLPQLLPGSPYSTRIPIGRIDVVKRATRADIERFYRQWFRPDLQAIVVVGDFNADTMLEHVRRIFAAVPAPSSPARQPHIDVDLPAGPRIATHADPEAGGTTVRLHYADPLPASLLGTADHLQHNTLRQLVAMLIAERLNKRTHAADSRLVDAGCSVDKFLSVGHLDALIVSGVGLDGEAQAILDESLTLLRQAAQHGFADHEVRQAIDAYRATIQQAAATVDRHPSSDYVAEYIDNFLHGGYIPGVVPECQAIEQVLDTLSSATVTQATRQLLDERNLHIVVTAPTLPGDRLTIAPPLPLPAPAIVPEEEAPLPLGPLVELSGQGGRIVAERIDSATRATVLTLSNGATVQLLPTRLATDEVLFDATRPCGSRDCPDDLDVELRLIDDVVENSTLGTWSQEALRRRLNATPLSLVYSLGETDENIAGNCRTRDLATLLQLNHLYFTAMRADTTAWRALRRQLTAMARQQTTSPEAIMADSIATTLYRHRALYRPLTESEIAGADFDKVLALYRQRVANIDQFTFTLVGDFDPDSVCTLVERYIGSIGSDSVRPHRPAVTAAQGQSPYPTGDVDNVFLQPMQAPKAHIYACMLGDMEHTLANRVLIDAAGQALTVALNAHLREDLHATYGVEAGGAASRVSGKWMLSAQLETQPELTQQVLTEVAHVFDIVMSYGTTGELLEHIRTQMLQQHDSQLLTNAYWLATLRNRALGFDSHTGYRKLVQDMSLAQLNAFIITLDPTTRLRVVMQGYKQ